MSPAKDCRISKSTYFCGSIQPNPTLSLKKSKYFLCLYRPFWSCYCCGSTRWVWASLPSLGGAATRLRGFYSPAAMTTSNRYQVNDYNFRKSSSSLEVFFTPVPFFWFERCLEINSEKKNFTSVSISDFWVMSGFKPRKNQFCNSFYFWFLRDVWIKTHIAFAISAKLCS